MTLEQLEVGAIRIAHTSDLVARFVQIKNSIGALEKLTKESGLDSAINYIFPQDDAGVRDIRALALKILEEVGAEDRALFLREITSAIAKPEIPSEIEEVRVMSLHKSKGLSAPVTIIAGCVEGLLPKRPDAALPQATQNAEIEEERRLFYVGISRVKASPSEGKPGRLIITYSRQMPLKDAMGAGIDPASVRYRTATLHASRFIREMGPAAPRPVVG